jgi:hypothetical protein
VPSAGEIAWRLRLPSAVHRVGKSALTGLGAMTGAIRTLPDFLIIGAQRGGTTSLIRYLERHPNVQSAMHKEIHYFDLNYARGEGWYRGHFPTKMYRRWVANRRGTSITGEATPYYMFHPLAAQRAADVVPKAKLIVLLRDPVERAISHYHHSVRRGLESLPLSEALRREEDRLAGQEARMEQDPDYTSKTHQYFSYVARGMYASQLRRWFTAFPRDQFLILESGRFRLRPDREFRRVLEFLDLPLTSAPRFQWHNAKPYEPADPVAVAWLTALFRPHNRDLFDLIREDLGWDAGPSTGRAPQAL